MFKKTREKSPYFHLAVDFGYTLLSAILLFGGIGYWLDNRYLTLPWFTIGGVFLGLAVAFNGLFKRLSLLERKEKSQGPRSKQKPPES